MRYFSLLFTFQTILHLKCSIHVHTQLSSWHPFKLVHFSLQAKKATNNFEKKGQNKKKLHLISEENGW